MMFISKTLLENYLEEIRKFTFSKFKSDPTKRKQAKRIAKLFKSWGIDSKETPNGIILFKSNNIYISPRIKMKLKRIERNGKARRSTGIIRTMNKFLFWKN